jgi:hypothetical protein
LIYLLKINNPPYRDAALLVKKKILVRF